MLRNSLLANPIQESTKEEIETNFEKVKNQIANLTKEN